MLKNIFRRLILNFSAILLSFLIIQPVASHPHVFIETRLFVELNDQGIKGFWQHWAFDEYFSAWVIEEFDADQDGKFSDEELKIVYERTFISTKEHGYFTRVLVGDREFPVTSIENFSVEIKENRTVYSCSGSITVFKTHDIKSKVRDVKIISDYFSILEFFG